MQQAPKDVVAYKRGFERGFDLCLAMKKLSREFRTILNSITSKDYHDSYGQGLLDGYQEGFRNIKRELTENKLRQRQQEAAEQQKQIVEQTSSPAQPQVEVDPRMQQRMARMQQQREGERGRDDQDLGR